MIFPLGNQNVPSTARVAAGALGFLTLIQAFDGPERYGASSFFETIPSRPRLQAAAYNWLASSESRRFDFVHCVAVDLDGSLDDERVRPIDRVEPHASITNMDL